MASTESTRRQALKAITSAGAAGLAVPGVAAAQHNGSTNLKEPQASEAFLEAKSELPAEWWAKDASTIAAKTSENVALIAEGTDQWVSSDEDAPDWFTIGEQDEFEYKPYGVYSLGGAGICIGTTVNVGPFEVGIEGCHYGGCEWKVSVCYGGCIGTGRQDDCDSIYTMSADLGAVSGDLIFNPHLGLNRDNEIVVSGQLCYYYILDSGCKNMHHTFNL